MCFCIFVSRCISLYSFYNVFLYIRLTVYFILISIPEFVLGYSFHDVQLFHFGINDNMSISERLGNKNILCLKVLMDANRLEDPRAMGLGTSMTAENAWTVSTWALPITIIRGKIIEFSTWAQLESS
jgi:hypothetical protein